MDKNRKLYSKLFWHIDLNDDRSAHHKLNVNIFDYSLSSDIFPETLSLHFNQYQDVSNFKFFANKTEFEARSNTELRDEDDLSTIISFEIPQIASAYPTPPPNPVEATILFEQKNVFYEFDHISIISLSYNCGSLAPRSIEVHVSLPELPLAKYYLDNTIIKFLGFFKRMGTIGVYKVDKAKGVQTQDFDIVKRGQKPIIKFRNTIGSREFPLIGVSFERAARPTIVLGEGGLIGGLITHFIHDFLTKH